MTKTNEIVRSLNDYGLENSPAKYRLLPEGMQIRPVVVEDLPALTALNNDCAPHLNVIDKRFMLHMLSEAIYFRVLEINDELAGFCLAMEPETPHDSLNLRWFNERYDDFLYIDRVAVFPQFQRSGVGRTLYGNVIDFAYGTVPLITAEVNVRPVNEPSLRFHKRMGFVEVGKQDTDGGAKTVSLLALDIAPHDLKDDA